ncbi:hypothetical protein TWF281_011421 [Arthrobotrys megalospora]
MDQMRCVSTGTPFVQVAETQPALEAFKEAETGARMATRSIAANAKKRVHSDTMEEENGDSKRRKQNISVHETRAGQMGPELGQEVGITNARDRKAIVPKTKEAQNAPKAPNKRPTKTITKRSKAPAEEGLTQEEAKRLARQNPGMQFAFDLDDKPQN